MVYIMNKQDDVYPPAAGYYQIIDYSLRYKDIGFDKRILSKALTESIDGRVNG